MFFPDAKIYLFGSYARGDARYNSDIDVAVDIGKRLPIVKRGQIMSMIDALNLVQNVDIVDFHSLPNKMKETIRQEGIAWKK